MKFIIGGERFYNPLILIERNKFDINKYINDKYKYRYKYLTGGGIYSLYFILKNINFKDDEYCMLPSYLCPTISALLDKLKINYKYYRVSKNLKIDIDYLDQIIDEKSKAFLFIDYFGFPHDKAANNYIANLKESGIKIIQDISQSLLPDYELIGDYCFNSFRKFIPVDGSVLLSNNEINMEESKNNIKYTLSRHAGRLLKYFEINFNLNTSRLYLKLFKKSEIFYYNSYNKKLDIYNKYLIKKIDIVKIINKRRRHYKELLNKFYEFAIIKELPEKVIPLGFPVLLKNRDKIRMRLSSENIYCPVHWKLPSNIEDYNFLESIQLSDIILTIPLNYSKNKGYISNISKLFNIK